MLTCFPSCRILTVFFLYAFLDQIRKLLHVIAIVVNPSKKVKTSSKIGFFSIVGIKTYHVRQKMQCFMIGSLVVH